jgi:3-hydroxyisobutyrate dehydrogenase-like beta-hydroxyacid dehydrogenase
MAMAKTNALKRKTKDEKRKTNKEQNGTHPLLCRHVARDEFADPGATMRMWFGSVQRREQQARDSDINGEAPAFLASLFKRGLAAGYGEEDMTALIKVLRA